MSGPDQMAQALRLCTKPAWTPHTDAQTAEWDREHLANLLEGLIHAVVALTAATALNRLTGDPDMRAAWAEAIK